jgi:hypothetical protein
MAIYVRRKREERKGSRKRIGKMGEILEGKNAHWWAGLDEVYLYGGNQGLEGFTSQSVLDPQSGSHSCETEDRLYWLIGVRGGGTRGS